MYCVWLLSVDVVVYVTVPDDVVGSDVCCVLVGDWCVVRGVRCVLCVVWCVRCAAC